MIHLQQWGICVSMLPRPEFNNGNGCCVEWAVYPGNMNATKFKEIFLNQSNVNGENIFSNSSSSPCHRLPLQIVLDTAAFHLGIFHLAKTND
jgi:hypothetical protein